MDNAQKAIMIGVGLFITIIIIAAVMAITGIGTNLLNQGQTQLGGLSSQLQQQITADFDNSSMSGSQVLAAIQKYYNDPNLVVAVYNTTTYTGAPVYSTPHKTSVDPTQAALPTGPKDLGAAATVVDNSGAGRIALNQFSSTTALAVNRVVTTAQYQAELVQINGNTVGICFYKKP